MSNTVMTVLGPVEADRLGSTLMHEHLIIDLCRVTRIPDACSTRFPWRFTKLTSSKPRAVQRLSM